jgi:hypothetical protein
MAGIRRRCDQGVELPRVQEMAGARRRYAPGGRAPPRGSLPGARRRHAPGIDLLLADAWTGLAAAPRIDLPGNLGARLRDLALPPLGSQHSGGCAPPPRSGSATGSAAPPAHSSSSSPAAVVLPSSAHRDLAGKSCARALRTGSRHTVASRRRSRTTARRLVRLGERDKDKPVVFLKLGTNPSPRR